MNECFTFCILAEPGLQSFTPIYFALLLLLSATLITSALLTRIAVISGHQLQALSPLKILSSKKTQVCLVLLLQIIVLASFQAKYAQVVKAGRTIMLEANPVDPFDFFRGNYQALSFPEGRLADVRVRFHDLVHTSKNSIVYVVFQADGKLWKATDVYETKPVSTLHSIIMKGRVDYYAGGYLNIHYGIEQYFFCEGKQVNMTEGAAASVHVDDNGDAVLTDLVASAKPARH
jgi:uncharacterized membrane-anchored protein